MTSQVWVDGDLMPAATARISALDLGFRSGVGVFETLRVDHGRAFRPSVHLARLTAGARTLGFTAPDERRLRRGIAETVSANAHLGDHLVLRITCSAGALDPGAPFPGRPGGPATTVLTAHPTLALPATPPTATAVTTDLRREVAGTKHTSYLVSVLAQQQAAAAGCTDGLLTTPDGAPLEAATANLLVVVGRTLCTPARDDAILVGVTRDAVLELARDDGIAVATHPVTAEQLHGAAEALLTSSVRGVRAVTSVDGHALGDGTPGPLTRRLAAAYRSLVDEEGEPVTLTGSPGG